jgi:hypothetical protein
VILMASIGILGIGLGGMRNGSAMASQAAFTATLLALLIGLLGARIRREDGAWAGFALFGWAYFLLSTVPYLDETFGDRLLVKQPLEDLVERFNDIPPMPSALPFQQATNSSGDQNGKFVDGQWLPMSPEEVRAHQDNLRQERAHWARCNQLSEKIGHSRRIGHSLLTLLFAALGAVVGRTLDPRRAVVATEVEGTVPR